MIRLRWSSVFFVCLQNQCTNFQFKTMINKMMTAALLAMAVATMHAQETIPLPVADKSNPMTLMQALQ